MPRGAARQWTTAAHRDTIERRCEAVAYLRLRGYSARQIASALPGMGITRPDGKAFGKSSVLRDMKVLKERWQKHANEDFRKHQAYQLIQLEEVQARAWRDKDYSLVLKAHDRIARLLGINNQPSLDVVIGGEVGVSAQIETTEEQFDAELRALNDYFQLRGIDGNGSRPREIPHEDTSADGNGSKA